MTGELGTNPVTSERFPTDIYNRIQGEASAYAILFKRYVAQEPDAPVAVIVPGGNQLEEITEMARTLQRLGSGNAPLHLVSFDIAYGDAALHAQAIATLEDCKRYVSGLTYDVFPGDWETPDTWERAKELGPYDFAVANPPYIATDPRYARDLSFSLPENYRDVRLRTVFSGNDGLRATRDLLGGLAPIMKQEPGSSLLFRCWNEVRSERLAAAIKDSIGALGVPYNHRLLTGVPNNDDKTLEALRTVDNPRMFLVQLYSPLDRNEAPVDSAMVGARESIRLRKYLDGVVLSSQAARQLLLIQQSLPESIGLTRERETALIGAICRYGELPPHFDTEEEVVAYTEALGSARARIIGDIILTHTQVWDYGQHGLLFNQEQQRQFVLDLLELDSKGYDVQYALRRYHRQVIERWMEGDQLELLGPQVARAGRLREIIEA